MSFPCIKCGACCRQVSNHTIYQYLDRGDGCCQHFEELTNECKVYDERPDICRIDLIYKRQFSQDMSLNEYYQLNSLGCAQLRELLYSNTHLRT